jgi:beta-lactamase class A
MAEHGDRSNYGNGPFRRYSPPAANGNGNGNGQGPVSLQPLSAAGGRSPRPNRTARRRWRQWVQPRPTKAAPPPTAAAPASAPRPNHSQSNAAGPGTTVPPQSYGGRPPLPNQPPQPHQRPQIPQPSPLVTGNLNQPMSGAAPDSRSRQADARPPSPTHRVQGQRSREAQPGATARPTGPGQKVTPFRRQPAWSTPEEQDGGGPRRQRSPRRKPERRAPRPVLYGIRLLVLGFGLAAIAGTLLSVLNPEQQGNTAAERAPNAAAPAANAGNNRSAATTLPSLSSGESLDYLANDLLELEALAPGLNQSTFLLDLDTGNYVDVNGGAAIAAASTIKVPILVAFFEAVDAGRISLDQGVTLTESAIVGGSGEMQTDPVGTRYTAYEVAAAMIITSDNTATELMIELLGGASALNQTFQAWGLGATVIRNPLPDLEGTNTTSPQDLVRVMALVEQGDLLSRRSRDRMLAIMQRTYARDLIPTGIGDQAIVFNKTGDIGALLGDVAIVEAPNGKRYAFAVLVERPHNDGRAAELIRRIAEAIHGEMNQPVAPIGGDVVPETATESPDAAPADASPESESADPASELPPG